MKAKAEMRRMYYILDSDHHVVAVDNILQWAEWFETADRHVAKTQINPEILVSTVFVGIDLSFGMKGPPVLFETMIFGGPFDQEQWRYSSWDDAETGHAMAVKKAKGHAKID